METALTQPWLSAEEYLAAELRAEVRHEYLGGIAYAMAGASEEHNTITGNIFAALHAHLRGGPCKVFATDMKVRLRLASRDLFYYPDLFVTCDPRDSEKHFKESPQVLVEVLSPDTEGTDRREKFLSYTQIPTLEAYVLVAQDKIEVTLFRRANNWLPEFLKSPGEAMRLDAIGFALPLAAIYEGVRA